MVSGGHYGMAPAANVVQAPDRAITSTPNAYANDNPNPCPITEGTVVHGSHPGTIPIANQYGIPHAPPPHYTHPPPPAAAGAAT